MKIDRLIGILVVLLQRERVTAPYLAEKFEVSRRTINRDVEALCQAGIPIVTTQGQNGGISIMEGYRMDRTLLTSSDMRAILAGLRSLDSVSGSSRYQQLMEKLAVGDSNVLASNSHIIIDLSSWYKSTLAPKIELIQEAIEFHEILSFVYYSPKGETQRRIEPYHLVFKWTSWYVWGFCLDKKDFRLFKLNRLTKLTNTREMYEPKDVPAPNLCGEKIYPATLEVEAVVDPDMKWRLIEEYGPGSFVEMKDGKLLFSFGFADKESLFGWILSLKDKVELLKPVELRRELMETFGNLYKRYKQ